MSNLLLQLIVFFLPSQFGLHFWPSFSRLMGLKVDYLSPTLYFTDILILLYIFVNSKKVFLKIISIFRNKKNLLSLSLPLINLLFSQNPSLSLVFWSRILLYTLLFFSLRTNKIKFSQISKTLFFSTVLIVFIEVAQFILQHSLNGPFYLLGERFFNFSTPNLARFTSFGLYFIRPSSIFSHPNSLAGFLLLIYFLFEKYPQKKLRFIKPIIILGLLLTFSKIAIFAFIVLFLLKISSKIIIPITLITPIALFLLPNLIYPNYLSSRLLPLPYYLELLKNHSIFGVGFGNYLPGIAQVFPGSYLDSFHLQPVHNLILLFTSEFGLLGIVSAIYVFVKKKFSPAILFIVSLVLLTGSFDHYWYTLVQNKLLLAFVFALIV